MGEMIKLTAGGRVDTEYKSIHFWYNPKNFNNLKDLALEMNKDIFSFFVEYPIHFDIYKNGLNTLVAIFLANRFLRGKFVPLDGTIEPTTKGKIRIYLEESKEEQYGEHLK